MSDLFWGALDGPPTRNSHAQVVDGIGGAIVRGDHAEGALLPGDDALAGRYGVSRTVLREATKTLTAKGLLVARARVGTRVRPRESWTMFDADVLRWHIEAGAGTAFFADLCEMRLGIEPFAAGLAAGRADAANIDAMRQHIAQMAGAADRRSFAIADFHLHREVIRASGNTFMHSVGALIEAALLTSFWISSPAEDAATQEGTARMHGLIVEAIAARDAAGAKAAMASVIALGRDRVSLAL